MQPRTATPSAVAAPLAEPSVVSGHLALVAVQLCFGLFPFFVKLALEGLEPRAIAVWRIGVGSAVLLGLAFAVAGRGAIPKRGDLPLLFVCGLLGVVMNQLLALEGVSRSTVVNAGLIMTLIPVFTVALAIAFRIERMHWKRAIGVPVAMCGAIVLLLQRGDSPDLARQHLFGNLLMACNCLSYAGYLLLSRRLLTRYRPLVVIAWVYVMSLWATPFLGLGQDLIPSGVDTRVAWWGLALVLTFPTVVGYLLNTFALSRVPASVTAIYIYVQPLIAGTAGIVLLGEHFRPLMIVAAALMFTGIALVTRRR
ncbi:DMT family transporter [Engelhardtia mirabilis]|uniref:EamA-like transporter family protein n=1 Tax=Engelhardtia mirabilis TaxID=2528011 RepID=A0A518BKY0_9BACT|nr:EamA-like transporter family protein [Planctomycetes bacterium Pla133]QDV01955.1 EamA-like transporter family protein [Planctomycetes bacterium Pla86]